jgi:Protein of unknown function (DUF3383)
MATVPPLPLSDIVDITVTIAPTAATANTFNQGLFIGPSVVIPSYGANSRVQQYAASNWSAAMLTAGFTTGSPEYIAMEIYFSQTPQPQYGWVGRQDLTAIADNGLTIDVAGTGWAVGDEFTITYSGASYGIGTVTAATSGVPSAIALVQGGTKYAITTGAATAAVSPSTGINLTVNITAVGETLLDAATACRNVNTTWYGLAVNNPADADNLALAAWADALWQSTKYYAWTSDTAVPNNVANNIAAQIQALGYRTLGIYATTQSGLYPNNIYAAAGLMGVEMGLNTGLAGSFFVVEHKPIAGIAPEPLTQTQYANIQALDWNAYCNFAPYKLLEPGFLSNGEPSFLWLYLAMLVNQLQIDELNVLTSTPAVPQTNAGQHLLLQAANQACQTLANIGFIAPGTWEGANVPIPSAAAPTLATGDPLPQGYLNQSASYATQSTGDRDAGKAMPIYTAITTAGAVQSLLIGVYVEL